MHTTKTRWKQKTIFDDSLGENPWGKPPPKKTRENQQKQYLKTLWEKPIDKIKKNSRKPKNQNFSENVWSEAHVCFFLVLPTFFPFFFLDLENTKKKTKLLFFLDNMMVKEL